jgi:DNA-binding IclR family transcriptional regulator
MRESGTWMTIWDDRILEILREEGPKSVGELTKHPNIRISHSQVSRRCGTLAEHGMLDAFANGVYDITEQGLRYLDGELDAEEIENENNGEGTAQA